MQATSNLVDQGKKNADQKTYAGYYGTGDGSTTFTLPIVGGEFIRMFDDGRGVDAGRVFGSHQNATTIQLPKRLGGWIGGAWADHLSVDAVLDENYVSYQTVNEVGKGSGYLQLDSSSSTAIVYRWDARPRNITFYGKTRL